MDIGIHQSESPEELVKSYIKKGTCYTADMDGETVGVILIMETMPYTIEVMNLAVKEELESSGFPIVDIDYDFFRRPHPEPIYDNRTERRDMIRMRIDLQ